MKLAIVHFQAVEGYPPAINLINYCVKHLPANAVSFFSIINGIDIPRLQFEGCKAYRPVKIAKKDKRLARLFKTAWFNFFTAFKLLASRPGHVLYYESSSAFPVFIYMLFSRKAKLYIHNHEYTSVKQYREGMLLDRIWHYLEQKYLYRRAKWLSQTNEDRCAFFLKDNPGIDPTRVKVLPNFPPQSWLHHTERKKFTRKPYRIVQIGSISTHHMYAKEFIEWVVKQNGEFIFDIYSLNVQDDLLKLLKQIDSPYINFKGPVSYSSIPDVLADYDIGVILYKANSENVVYCASNKLFEYLALDIDVWVTTAMIGSKPYYRNDVYPKVLPVSFDKMDQFNWSAAIDRTGLNYRPSPFYMEKVYEGFLKSILN